MTLSVIESDAFHQMEEIWNLHLKENLSEYAIARKLGIKVIEARNAIQQFQEIIRNDMDATDAARDHLNAMVKRYEYLMAEATKNLTDLKALAFDERVSAQINATLKNIADFDAKRVDALQKAGLLDAADVGDEVARMEERHEMIIGILKNDLCEDCRLKVRDKMSILTGQTHGNVIEGEVVSDDG